MEEDRARADSKEQQRLIQMDGDRGFFHARDQSIGAKREETQRCEWTSARRGNMRRGRIG